MDYKSQVMPIVIMGMLCWVLSQSVVSSAEEEGATPCSSAAEMFGSPIELTPEVQTTILNWLDCEECTYAQLKSVVQLGPGVVPFFAVALERGPSRQKCASLDQFLKMRHAELHKYQNFLQYQNFLPDATFLLSEEDYRQVHLIQLVTQYQIQAATALGAIGGPLAKRALRQALDRKLPEVVRLAVQDALKPRNR